MKSALFFSLWLVSASTLFAQVDTIYNPQSIEKIPYYEQLYRFRVNRVIDLQERQNKGFDSRKSSIKNLIMSLIDEGKLKIYAETAGEPFNTADSAALTLGQNFDASQTQGEWDGNRGYQAGEQVIYLNKDGKKSVYRARTEVLPPSSSSPVPTSKKGQAAPPPSAPQSNKNPIEDTNTWEFLDQLNQDFSPQKIASLELIEDVIFDKRRSRLYYDILALGVIMEDTSTPDGLGTARFNISYKEFANEVNRLAHSKDLAERRRVQWQNMYNPSEWKTFTDAFKLRLFHGVIRKVENPDDFTVQQVFEANDRSFTESVFARWEQEMIMMEKEHNLWEY